MIHRSIFIFITCFFIISCEAQTKSQHERSKPNIIFILADDLGYGELGSYGQTKINTPHLDQMAKEGMRFTQFYSAQTVCAPSRCSLLTGLHQGHAQIRDNSGHLRKHLEQYKKQDGFPTQYPLNDKTVTIGHVLQKHGYTTGCVGKWGLGHPSNEGSPNRQGFDFYYGYICQVQAHNYYPRYLWRNNKKEVLEGNDRGLTGKQYASDLMDDECIKFIRRNKDKPFFLYYASPIPHLALQVPEKDLAEYKGKFDEIPYRKPKGERIAYLPHEHPRAAYAAMVSHLDRAVGKIVKTLRELNLEDDTLIMFSSDNGPSFLGGYDRQFFNGSGGLRGYKGNLYEGGLRVPFIAKWPGKIKAGSQSDLMCASYDLFETIRHATGAYASHNTDGISFLPELTGEGLQRKHQYLYWEFHGYGGWQVMRMGHMKAVRKNMHKGNLKIELYDLDKDPKESKNIVSDPQYGKVLELLKELMKKEHEPNPLFPLTALGDKRGY